MSCDIELVREEGPDAPQLKNTLAAVHDGQFVYIHEGFAQLLIVQGMRSLAAPAFSGVVGVHRLFPQCRRQLF